MNITGSTQRKTALEQWFISLLPELSENSDSKITKTLRPISGDASFRRYFLGHIDGKPYVLVDAPPETEDNQAFVAIARAFQEAGLNVPEVYAVDYEQGFMCISWLGKTLLLERLKKLEDSPFEAGYIYQQALDDLLIIQKVPTRDGLLLPRFDRTLYSYEFELFTEWFCSGLMRVDLNASDLSLLDYFFQTLIESAMSQPQVCVHRDYHSRNLVYNQQNKLGILDFQDAVIGPVTYDLVSLLKDCYIAWPRREVTRWALNFASKAQDAGIISNLDEQQFLRDFDLMGVQRHLKAIGIFSRLYLRDSKPGYLADIPRCLVYIKEVVSDDPDMFELAHWLEKRIYPTVFNRLKNSGQRAVIS